jgi:pseudomonalisin/xanthomonalisin
MLLATFGSAASAAPGWVGTATHRTDVYSDAGAPVAAAEEVAPGQEVQIAVSLKLRNRDALDQRIARIRAGSSADIISTDQLAGLHLPTAAQVDRVVQHLSQAGFRYITVAPNRLLITATGSAGNVKSAFNTTLYNFGAGASRVFANVGDAQVPAALSDLVLAVHGLQNASHLRPMYQLAGAVDATDAGTLARTRPPKPVGHTPTDFPLIYGASSMPAATNAVVGIISNGEMNPTLADLAKFETSAGFTAVPTTVTYVGTHGTDTSGTIEWDLDSQSSLSAAGGKMKELVFYVATTLADAPLLAAFNQAVVENRAKVINVSLGGCETSSQSSGFNASGDQIFAVAVSQGQTFSVSTGDSGSLECGRRAGNEQSYPAVSPYVMAIGGTTLTTTGTTAYLGETTWKSGGGGPSTTEAAPSWQVASGVLGGGTGRGVPDISFDADPNSGAKIIVNGVVTQVGGTSLSAPLFSGFWARIQSNSGKVLGFPDASIYKYAAANPALFHDVTSGSNGGFTAAAGWDYGTGWGSVNIGAMATFIANTPGF